MYALSQTQVFVAESVLLDARLALFHQRQKWLAIADLHFGFELSHRAAGYLLPWWGMNTISQRLLGLLSDYQPDRLIIVGDLVHDKMGAVPVQKLLAAAGQYCEIIAVAGNHDCELRQIIEFVDSFALNGFEFHHGHCRHSDWGGIEIRGHLHPAAMLRDGAGLHLKFPAFVQEETCWILPAFSPWAAGSAWPANVGSRVWLCTPTRILSLPTDESDA